MTSTRERLAQLSEKIERSRLNTWGYRVVRRTATVNGEHDESYEVIEAYYDTDGKLTAWCPATPAGNTVNELYDDLNRMMAAVGEAFLTAPTFAPIDYADLPGLEDTQ